MNIWGWLMIGSIIVIVISSAWLGFKNDIVTPFWLAITFVSSCTGYTLGFGVKIFKQLFL